MRPALVIALTAILAVSELQAQAETPRDNQLRMLEHQRKFLLALADSMPERLYRDKATPAQRDFAQQIHHAASVAAYIASTTLKGPKLSLPDTATALKTEAGLKGLVNAAYDYCAGLLQTQSAESRARQADLFGQSMPAWQVWDEIEMHTIWTAGQVVANFRKNGMAPPEFTFF